MNTYLGGLCVKLHTTRFKGLALLAAGADVRAAGAGAGSEGIVVTMMGHGRGCGIVSDEVADALWAAFVSTAQASDVVRGCQALF